MSTIRFLYLVFCLITVCQAAQMEKEEKMVQKLKDANMSELLDKAIHSSSPRLCDEIHLAFELLTQAQKDPFNSVTAVEFFEGVEKDMMKILIRQGLRMAKNGDERYLAGLIHILWKSKGCPKFPNHLPLYKGGFFSSSSWRKWIQTDLLHRGQNESGTTEIITRLLEKITRENRTINPKMDAGSLALKFFDFFTLIPLTSLPERFHESVFLRYQEGLDK